VLDNFEHVMDQATRVAELRADCPLLKMLVTSREVLHLVGELTVLVPPMAVPDPQINWAS
jgi:predicted ATPase